MDHVPTAPKSAPRAAARSAFAVAALPAITCGFATTVAVWVGWWFAHLPGLPAIPFLEEAVLVIALPIAAFLAARAVPRSHALLAGIATAVVSAVLDLVVLGAAAAGRDPAYAFALVAVFLAVSLLLGGAGGLAARQTHRRAGQPDPMRWLSRFAWVACLAFLPLIIVGGAVTSTESGMAVDEPIVSLVMPLSTMGEPRVYIEHTHRLFGSLVGLTVLTWLALTIWRGAGRTRIAWVATVFGLVCVQGILGATRVAENAPAIAALHGVFGQLVFGCAVAAAALFAPLYREDTSGWPGATKAAARRGALPAALALAALIFQLLTGSLTRHLNSAHAVIMHVLFAFAAAGLVTMAGAVFVTAEPFSRAGLLLRRLGKGLVGAVVLQVSLGFFALIAVGDAGSVRPIPLESELAEAHRIEIGEALATTAHQSNGALLLALSTLSVVWARRLRGERPGPIFSIDATARGPIRNT